METYLIYTGKAAIAAGAFYIAFLLLFQNQKHFTFNRIYLPVSLALSFVIPLITFTTIKYIEPVTITDSGSFAYLPVPNEIPQQPAFVFEWYHYLFGLYLLGTIGFLFHLLLGHLKAINIIQKSRIQKIFNNLVNITQKDVHPFSFFSKIVVSEKTLSHPDLEIIVSHENIHVREKHTLDILFTEIMFLLQWFNPFAWLLKDAVKNNLEYLTDHEIAKHYNPQTYQLAMVTLADKQGIAPFLTALNGSQLKNRIIMMKKKTENKYAFVKQLVVLPLLAVLVMGLSNKVEKTELIHEDPQTIEIKNSDSSNFRVIIDGEVIPTNTPEMQQLNLEEVLDVPASANNFNSLGKISREILKVQNINPAKIEGTHYAGRFPDVSTLFIRTTDYVEGTNLEFEKHMNRDSSRTIADNYIKSKIAEDNILRFEDFKIIVDGKEISTDKPEFKNIKLTEENNYNGRINIEIIEALNIDLNDIRSSKSSSNSPNPFLFIRTKDYVEGSNPEFDKMMERTYAPPFFNSSKPDTEGEKVITGKVTDEKGNPIEGASIEVKGRQFGVITDKNGNYKIEIEPSDEALIYGYLYHDKKEVKIGDKNKIDLRLKTDGNPPTDGSLFHKSFRMRNSNGDLVKPMYIFDGKEIAEEELQTLKKIVGPPIKAQMLSDSVAVKMYGEKGRNGVVILNSEFGKEGPLYIVDGVEVKSVENLKPDEIEKIDVLKGESGFNHYGEKGKNGVVLIYTKAKNNSQPEELNIKPKWTDKNGNHVFYKVEAMPEFPGGEMALLKYITNQTKYPEIARENGIQGKVYVSFIITKEGKVTEPTISKGVDLALDTEALRVIGSLPDWKPGKQGGQAVNVWYTVPITFGLQNQNSTNDGKTNIITSVQELRQFIANQVVFPKEARDEHNSPLNMFFYVKINNNGEVTNVSEKPNGDIVEVGEIVITAERDKTVLPEVDIKNANLMAAEAERVLKSLPKIDVPELKGKTARMHFMFVLK
jgi:bla regulator protein blaR1